MTCQAIKGKMIASTKNLCIKRSASAVSGDMNSISAVLTHSTKGKTNGMG